MEQQLEFPFMAAIRKVALEKEAHEEALENVPYFIKMRGCINCSAYQAMQKKGEATGQGFDHEIAAKCFLMGCVGYKVSIISPFIDPEEAVQFALRPDHDATKERAKAYCQHIKKEFGEHYATLGISIDDIIAKLDA